MPSLSQLSLSLWMGGVMLAGGLTGCGDGARTSSASEVAGSQPAQYRANDCRSPYSQTTQKGCRPELPLSTAGNLSR